MDSFAGPPKPRSGETVTGIAQPPAAGGEWRDRGEIAEIGFREGESEREWIGT